MFEKATILYIYVETPLHAGSGAGLGPVDLPIQRERVTGYPMVQASGIKGVLRSEAYSWEPFTGQKEQCREELLAEGKKPEQAESEAHRKAAIQLGLEAVFGPETDRAHEHAGALSPGDARLLLFPVRSLLGVFAWTTSEDVLARFQRDALAAGLTDVPEATGPASEDTALVSPGSDLVADDRLVLEEFAFKAKETQVVKEIGQWLADNALPEGAEYAYWREKLPQRLVILPENAFRDFTRFATEVVTRIRLDRDTKTVVGGALWSEEHLPTDTLLYAPLYATRPRSSDGPPGWEAKDVLELVQKAVPNLVQLGGDETIGKGLVRLRFCGGRNDG